MMGLLPTPVPSLIMLFCIVSDAALLKRLIPWMTAVVLVEATVRLKILFRAIVVTGVPVITTPEATTAAEAAVLARSRIVFEVMVLPVVAVPVKTMPATAGVPLALVLVEA